MVVKSSSAKTTYWANQWATSASRQSSRFVPGKRQIGGSDFGLRVASLRTLLTDLWIRDASISTVSKVCMATPVRARLVFNRASSDECGAPVAVTYGQIRVGLVTTQLLSRVRMPSLVTRLFESDLIRIGGCGYQRRLPLRHPFPPSCRSPGGWRLLSFTW